MSVENLIKVVLHWHGYGEEGTISWHLGLVSGMHSTSSLVSMLDNIVHRWETDETPSAKTRLLNLITQHQQYDSLTCYQYAVDTDSADVQATVPITWGIGSSNTMSAPLQVALVATTLTNIPGARYRGRQYFPMHTTALQEVTGLYDTTPTDFVALLAAEAGTSVQDGAREALSDDPIRWCVYSRAGRLVTPVASIKVDNKADTQRRREHSLAPTYVKHVSI